MHVIAFIEDPDVIKKILNHLGLWDVKRKPRPLMFSPHMTSSRVPVRMITTRIRITLQRPILKTTLGQPGFLFPKFQHFSRFGAKCRLDNTIFTWYSNLDCQKPFGIVAVLVTAQYFVTHPQPSHNINNFSFFTLKREFFILCVGQITIS